MEIAKEAMDLGRARAAAEEGQVEVTLELAGEYPGHPAFTPLHEKALRTAAPRYEKRVRSCLKAGRWRKGIELCRLFGDIPPFPELLRDLRGRVISKARDDAERGDVASVEAASEALPDDPELGTILTRARQVKEKADIERAEAALARGAFREAIEIAEGYRDDPTFRSIWIRAFDQGAEHLVRVRKQGEEPTVRRCEVSGNVCNADESGRRDFKSLFEQCRLCGRWVQQGESSNVAGRYIRKNVWSDALACCRVCADAVARRRRKAARGSEG